MPKKTKREKVIAQYRRKLHQFHETASEQTPRILPLQGSQQEPSSPFVFQATTHAAQNTITSVQPMDQAVRAGLIKTLLLAIIAIGAEVGLSILLKR